MPLTEQGRDRRSVWVGGLRHECPMLQARVNVAPGSTSKDTSCPVANCVVFCRESVSVHTTAVAAFTVIVFLAGSPPMIRP